MKLGRPYSEGFNIFNSIDKDYRYYILCMKANQQSKAMMGHIKIHILSII